MNSQRFSNPPNHHQYGSKRRTGSRSVSMRLPVEEDQWDEMSENLDKFDEDMKRLYQVPLETIEYISCGGTLEDDPVLLTPEIVAQQRRAQRKKQLRLQRAHRVFKLDADLAASMEAKGSDRGEWEKRFSTRHNQRYWRHKVTGVSRTVRPYMNPGLSCEEDSTEESEVSLGSSDEQSSSEEEEEEEEEESEESEEGRRSNSTRSREGDDRTFDSSRRSTVSSRRSTVSSRRSSSASDLDSRGGSSTGSSEAESSASEPETQSSVADTEREESYQRISRRSSRSGRASISISEATGTTGTEDASTEQPTGWPGKELGAARGDQGIWVEKMSAQWGIPYWRNKDTRHVVWHCPSATAPGSPISAQRKSPSPSAQKGLQQQLGQDRGGGSNTAPGAGSPGRVSRYYVTQLVSLATKAGEKERRDKRRQAHQWAMKYSVEYDGFYYKNRVTKVGAVRCMCVREGRVRM